ncbi:hypothetical protein PLESTM_001382200 [Pleodorina starrii]|nr:hypothetical protein PLESTM_001382200 [Pleodorina starrii]
MGRQRLGVASYGLSLTTLEEVFLSISAAAAEEHTQEQTATITAGGGAAAAADAAGATATAAAVDSGTRRVSNGSPTDTRQPSAAAAAATSSSPPPQRHPSASPPPPPPAHPAPLRGWRLYGQQLRALFAKRALCARRDRLAVLTQLAVPLALVYLALWISSLQVREPSEPPLELSRRTALLGRPLAWSASPTARNASEGCSRPGSSGGGGGGGGSSCLAAFLAGHPGGAGAIDSGATELYTGDPRVRLEDYLLARWYTGFGPVYDALHVTNLPSPVALVADASWPPQPPQPLPPSPPPVSPPPALSFVLLTNQSAVSALPAALAEAMTAAWSYIDSGLPPPPPSAAAVPQASPQAAAPSLVFSAASWPLPTLATEPVARIQRDASSLMLVLCLVLASSVLSASFVVFIVREQDNNSKHLQLVSGAPATAYWAANYGWDLISYGISAAGLFVLIVSYRLPQYSGQRLAAVAGLLTGFGPAGISLTYLLHFLFRDEMRALQRLNTAYFLTGYLGFVATWICDLIEMLVPRSGSLHSWNTAAKWALRTASPHYCFARGMYDVQATYDSGLFPFGKRSKPFDWDVFGSPMAHMVVQTLVYGTLAVLYDAGMLTVAYAYGQDATRAAARWFRRQLRRRLSLPPPQPPRLRQGGGGWWGLWRRQRQRQHDGGGVEGSDDNAARLLALEEGVPLLAEEAESADGGAMADGNNGRDLYGGQVPYSGGGEDGGDGEGGAAEEADDEDVAAEKRSVVEGRRAGCQVLLDGVRKSYSQGLFRPAVPAVRGLWLGVPAGECFGLLGVNGAGKTTTFRMLTGEVMPDAGDARVGGLSVRTQLAAARRQLGYCPQFEALPGAMTGREVAAMYARLRGVPEPYVGGLVSYLLRRLGLEAAADSPCGGYSGGMKRKLGVAVALVGDPRVCVLDEPSTGMDPGARRGLWSCLQSEVIRAGRTVVLTSHSMEECEALCTRLTILVAGRLRCLGTVQHLKSRFGGGYLLEIKTLPRSTSATSLAVPSAAEATAGAVQAPPSRPLELSVAVAAAAAPRGGAADAWGSPAAGPAPGGGGGSLGVGGGTGGGAGGVAAAAAAAEAEALTAETVRGAASATAAAATTTAAASPSSPPSVDLAALFEAVESHRSALGVVDYCLTQTTLEQLFVEMAGAAAAEAAAEGEREGV